MLGGSANILARGHVIGTMMIAVKIEESQCISERLGGRFHRNWWLLGKALPNLFDSVLLIISFGTR